MSFGKVASSLLGFVADAVGDRAASSNWGSINPDLIATLVPIDADGKKSGEMVKALVKDGSMEQSFEWKSAFEEMTLESKRPGIFAGAQSGAAAETLQTLGEAVGGVAENAADSLADTMKAGQGKSTITKLNSRQVYMGHSPLEISMTLVLRAWTDAYSEVMYPFSRLQMMAYPKRLADDPVSAAAKAKENGEDFKTAAIFPSDAPKFVALYYKGECYKPLVIESIGKPLDAPYSAAGDIFLEVPIKLTSYSSLDFRDISASREETIGMIGNHLGKDAVNAVSSLFIKNKPAKIFGTAIE